MKKNILSEELTQQASLSLEDYQKLKEGLKKSLISKSGLYTIGKGCLVLGLPIMAVNTLNGQCQTFTIANSTVPETGNFANGLGVDLDGDMVNDLFFYEQPDGNGKVRRAAGGSVSIVRTGGAFPFGSAYNFGLNDPIPNGLAGTYRGYWDYGGAGGQWDTNGGVTATGFMGIKIGTDYGFLEFTVNRTAVGGGTYFATFPSGGAPESTSGNATAGDCNTLLPVEFTSFITRTHGNNVTLIWRTSSETNNSGFQVQRSENGRDFENIHWVDGQGTSFETTTYKHVDEDLRPGKTYYYRLNQIDFDGRSDLSPIVSVNIKGEVSEVGDFYPNPSEGAAVSINVSAFEAGEWTSEVYDTKGVLIKNRIYQLEEGPNNIEMNTENLSAGTYFVKFENGKERFYKTLIVR